MVKSDQTTLAVVCLLLPGIPDPQEAHMYAQAIRTQRDDDASARQCIEAAIARRKDEFALSQVAWTADYGYILKFHLGAVEVVRTAVEMLVFEESWRMDIMLHGVRLTFNALAPSSEAFGRRVRAAHPSG